MIRMISCHCPDCNAQIEYQEGRSSLFCTHCGAKIFVQDDSVTRKYIHKRITDDAAVIRAQTNDRIKDREMDLAERRERNVHREISFKSKLIVFYIILVLILVFVSYVGYVKDGGMTAGIIQITTIALVTVPVMILISKLIIEHGGISEYSHTESSFWGFRKESTNASLSPGGKVLILWLVYLILMAIAFYNLLKADDYSFKKHRSVTGVIGDVASDVADGVVDKLSSIFPEEETKEEREEKERIIGVPDYYENIADNHAIYDKDVEKQYCFMSDRWDYYTASIISKDYVQIKKYSRISTGKKDQFEYEYDVNNLDINESKTGFRWLDQYHTSFVINLHDEKNYSMNVSTVAFVQADEFSDNWTEDYSVEGTTYSYRFDKWNLYKAIILNDELIKIENWHRFSADDKTPFEHESDVCVICQNSEVIKWLDDDHISFMLDLYDKQNWDEPKTINACFVQDGEKQ